MKRNLLILTILLLGGPLRPQGKPLFPKLSPPASVSQTIGTTEIRVDFHRPAVRFRKIWGDLVPFGQVWRAGANEATTIRFSDPVKVAGKPVPAGTYAVFMIPGPDQWTVILNKRWRQQGAYEYDPREDVARFTVTPKVVSLNEWLTYEIYPASLSTAYVDMYWEKLRVSFLVEVDVKGIVTARMKKAMAQAKPGDWKLFADAAEYLLEQDGDLAQALTWCERSIQVKENPSNLHLKSRIQLALGQQAGARQTLDQAIRLAKAQSASPSVLGPLEATLAQLPAGTPNGGEVPKRR
ncbi:MAG: DUF2911 domain-containing protein [Acidobacteria bacterium]|nr:DUF2911 domain-containing protein [Acidobacteriota bacterium]